MITINAISRPTATSWRVRTARTDQEVTSHWASSCGKTVRAQSAEKPSLTRMGTFLMLNKGVAAKKVASRIEHREKRTKSVMDINAATSPT